MEIANNLCGSLLGYRGKKNCDSGIVYVPYIPVQISPEQAQILEKQRRANWTYATVSLDHPSAYVRHKRGKVLDIRTNKNGVKEFCLLIDKMNSCSKSGHYTLIGVSERAYEKEWVEEKYIKKFEKYDSNGNEIADESN